MGSSVFGASAGARRLPCPGCGVGIPDDDPQRAVIGEHLAHRAEHVNQVADVLPNGDLPSDLQALVRMSCWQVAAQAEVWRAGHAHLHLYAVLVHLFQQLAAIAGMGAIEPATRIIDRPAHDDDPPFDGPAPVPLAARRR